MDRERRQAVQARTGEVLDRLSEPERQLLKRVLRIEHENIHLTKPRVADDMLRAVRETIK